MVLQAGSKSLTESGLKQNSRILVLCSSAKSANRVAAQEKASEAEEARTARLQRVREAAAAIAKRSSRFIAQCCPVTPLRAGCLCLQCPLTQCFCVPCRYGSNQAYEFALENQAGQAINIGKEDREAIITALIVHDGAKKHLQKGAYQDALSELLVAEEAASLCSDDLLAAVDNVGMLMLDIVWYVLQCIPAAAAQLDSIFDIMHDQCPAARPAFHSTGETPNFLLYQDLNMTVLLKFTWTAWAFRH